MKATHKTLALFCTASLVLGLAVSRDAAARAQQSAPTAASDGAVISGDQAAVIDQYLSSLIEFGFSGSVLLADKGVLHKGYGVADVARQKPVTTETVFDIGSLTKQFTAAAIMKLEMAGKLSTSDPMNKYLPDVPVDKAQITLHHLLTHTAGLGMYSGGDYDVSLRDETVSRILATPLQTKPGEAFSYSNPGYSLLAAIIERVSGEAYETFLRSKLFEPAGMHMTGYRLPRWEGAQLARGYMDTRERGTPLDHRWAESGPYWNLFGNGGMLSTTGDLHKWAQALKGDEILSTAAKEKLFTPALKNYAYGWRVAESSHGRHISHGGDSDNGFSANFNMYPERDAVVIVLTNRIPLGDFLFQRRIVKRITPALFGERLETDPPVRPAGDAR